MFITSINVLKNKKTSSSLDDLYINEWKEKKRKVEMGTLYLESCNL